MLKLIKYELKATARTFLPLYGGLFILSLCMRLFMMTNLSERFSGTPATIVSLIFGIVGLLYGLVLSAVFILTAFVMIQRFYKNLLGDEGYLMFTLPVPTWKHIAAKSVVSAIWICVSFIGVLISSFLMVMTLRDARDFFRSFPKFFSAVDITASEAFGLLGLCLFMLLCLFCGILVIYASISLGQLWSRHKIFGAFLSFTGIWVGIIIIISVAAAIWDHASFGYMFSSDLGMHLVVSTMNAVVALIAAGCFFLSNFMLKKRLNLE